MNYARWVTSRNFAAFAMLLAARDIAFDYHLRNLVSPVLFSAMIFTACACFGALYSGGPLRTLSRALNGRRSRVAICLTLSFSSILIYLITFLMIGRIGAGWFNVLDYGLTPVVTVALGIIVFHEPLATKLAFAAIACVCGLALMFSPEGAPPVELLLLVAISPFLTAASDAASKWLMSASGGGLSRPQILLWRFAPGCLILWIIVILNGASDFISCSMSDILIVALASVVLGLLPLIFLLRGLSHEPLRDLAVWEFCIPAVSYLATIPAHPEYHSLWLSHAGAAVILAAVALNASAIDSATCRNAIKRALRSK